MTSPIDLTGAQARFEDRVMSDTCQIKRVDTATVDDTGDEAFDESTGTYGPAQGTEAASDVDVYGFPDPGVCGILPAPTTRTARQQEGEVYRGPGRLYEAYLPLSVVDVRTGDIVKGVTSLRDPAIPGTFYVVTAPLHSTFPVARLLQIRELTLGEQNFGRW